MLAVLAIHQHTLRGLVLTPAQPSKLTMQDQSVVLLLPNRVAVLPTAAVVGTLEDAAESWAARQQLESPGHLCHVGGWLGSQYE